MRRRDDRVVVRRLLRSHRTALKRPVEKLELLVDHDDTLHLRGHALQLVPLVHHPLAVGCAS